MMKEKAAKEEEEGGGDEEEEESEEEEEGEGGGEDEEENTGPTQEDGQKYLSLKRKNYEKKLSFTDMMLEEATMTLDKSKQYLKMMEKDGDTDKIIYAELLFRK